MIAVELIASFAFFLRVRIVFRRKPARVKIVSEVIADAVESAADAICPVVVTPSRMRDQILAHARRRAFEQTKFTQQDRLIRQHDKAACEQGQRLDVDLARRQRRFDVAHAALAPDRDHPLRRVIITVDCADPVFLAESGVFLRDLCGLERPAASTHEVHNEFAVFPVDNAECVGIAGDRSS